MVDIALIFNITKTSSSKERAIKIAEKYENYKKNDQIRVVFHKYSADLVTLLEICKKWDSSELFVNNQEYRIPEVLKILKCRDKNYCDGFCNKGMGYLYAGLKDDIENATKGIYDEFSDPESLKRDLSRIPGIIKEKDGSYRIDKNEMEKNLLVDFNLPMVLCENIEREKMFNFINQLPESFKISDNVITVESHFEGFSDYQIAEFTSQAKIMGPIIAKCIAREMDKVFIANFGSENDETSCFRKGDCLFELARYEESLNCFEKALNFNRKNPETLFSKSLVLFYMERYLEAEAPIAEYLALDPKNPRAWRLQGEIFEKNKKYKESINSLRKSIDWFNQELKGDPEYKDLAEEIESVRGKITELERKCQS